MRVAALALTILLAAGAAATDAADVTKSDGLSLFGDLKYGADFSHFDYVNPDAPKGGTVRYSSIGTFDNLNLFILKGNAAAGLGGLFDTLMFPAGDEPASAYGLVAESVEVPADRSWVQYNLRKEARFQDGSPITPEDVIWTFETLKEKGHPRYRLYYADVMKAEKVGARSVKFSFRTGNKLRCRAHHHLPPRRGLLGKGSAGQSRAEQLRRHPL
jgi:microcin C transport system substrate-binding protein